MQFSIDSVVVATDTFRVNLPNPHTMSIGISTTSGSHVLGARVVGNINYVWPDTVVSLQAGGMLTKTLPLYCS